jgi:hypothetical protein
MIQRYSLLILCFLFLQCAGTYTPLSNVPFVHIEFDVPGCVTADQNIPICFKISNFNDNDILVNTWALTFYFDICDTAGVSMPAKIMDEKVAPSYKKYLLIKKHSIEIFCTEKLALSNYELKVGSSYIIQAKYRNNESAKDTVATCLGEIGPYKHLFKICN